MSRHVEPAFRWKVAGVKYPFPPRFNLPGVHYPPDTPELTPPQAQAARRRARLALRRCRARKAMGTSATRAEAVRRAESERNRRRYLKRRAALIASGVKVRVRS